jgi:LacI family transcriptional regulator
VAEVGVEVRATLSSVAQAAGVSLATVSKVVNDREDVAPATRARVRELLREHNYVPVRRRRNVGAPLLVDLVVRGLDSTWAMEIIRGATSTDLDVVVSSMTDVPDPMKWAEHLAKSGRAGVIVVTTEFTHAQKLVFERARMPCVVVDPVDLPDPDVPSVGATNWAGGLTATRHLLGLGHQRIGVVGGPPSLLCSRARVDGYRAALEGAGLEYDPALVRDGNFHHIDGYEQGGVLLSLPDPPTAIFAGSDEQAFGVLESARVAGLRVPHDLSVVGFDDTPIARWASPPLTTVRQPLAEMGRMAAQMLQTLIGGRPLDNYHVELATELVIRASTQALTPTAHRVIR